jgi:hypothetical protein
LPTIFKRKLHAHHYKPFMLVEEKKIITFIFPFSLSYSGMGLEKTIFIEPATTKVQHLASYNQRKGSFLEDMLL